MAFRNLAEPGGPEFSEGQVKALAATYQIADFDDKGAADRSAGPSGGPFPAAPSRMTMRPAPPTTAPCRPTCRCSPRHAVPSRASPGFIWDVFTQYQEQGPDYIHALITDGYLKDGEKPPLIATDDPNNPDKKIISEFKVPEGAHYNKVFEAHSIAMAKPIQDGQVEYTDGAPQTVDQYTKDVAAFLAWTGDPSLVERKQQGFKVLLFLIVLSGLLWYTKKKVWADAH